jgi:hypothetical protein
MTFLAKTTHKSIGFYIFQKENILVLAIKPPCKLYVGFWIGKENVYKD